MDALLASLQTIAEGKIDFEGQKLADQIVRNSIPVITALSFIIGFLSQSLQTTFITLGSLTILVALVVIPQWPTYNKHPMKWLPAKAKKKE